MIVLGIADGADAGAALVVDDAVVAVAEQERFDRKPHSAAFPHDAIESVLASSGIEPHEVDMAAVAGRYSPPFFVRRHPGLRSIIDDPFSPALDLGAFYQAMLRQTGLGALEAARAGDWFEAALSRRSIQVQRAVMVDIHKALATAAYRTQGRADLLVLTLQPMGDGVGCAVSRGVAGQLDRVWEQRGFASLHVHTRRIMATLGLPVGDEAVLWGLAAQGQPQDDLLDLLAGELHSQGRRLSRRAYPLPPRRSGRLYRALRSADRADAAASVVENLRRAVCSWIEHHVSAEGIGHIAVGGAVFENPHLITAISELACVESLWVCPAVGASALPLGAALAVAGTAPRALPATLGPHAPEARDLQPAIDALREGKPVGWFVGREGPGRIAGGARCVLALASDPQAVAAARGALRRHAAEEPVWLPAEHHAVAKVGVPRSGGSTVNARPCHGVTDAQDSLHRLVAEVGGEGLFAFPLGMGSEPATTEMADAQHILEGAGISGFLGDTWWER